MRGWFAWQVERQALLDLDAHLLKDVGVSGIEAEHIASRPFTTLKRFWHGATPKEKPI